MAVSSPSAMTRSWRFASVRLATKSTPASLRESTISAATSRFMFPPTASAAGAQVHRDRVRETRREIRRSTKNEHDLQQPAFYTEAAGDYTRCEHASIWRDNTV